MISIYLPFTVPRARFARDLRGLGASARLAILSRRAFLPGSAGAIIEVHTVDAVPPVYIAIAETKQCKPYGTVLACLRESR